MDADAQQLWGVLVLVVVALVGAAIAFGTDGRIAPAHEKRGIDAAKGLDAPNEEIG